VLAALVIGNGQQAGQGRVAGQVSWRKCGNWRTSCPTLHASILAIAMLIAACMKEIMIEGDGNGMDQATILPDKLAGTGDQFSIWTPW